MVRPLQENDRTCFLALCEAFYRSDAVLHPIPTEYIERTFESIMENSPYIRGFLLEWEGTAAGYALMSFHYSSEAGGLCAWLDELYVKEEFAGRGLGTEFLSYMRQAMPKVARFRLEICQENRRAAKLYERVGFEELPYVQYVLDTKEVPV